MEGLNGMPDPSGPPQPVAGGRDAGPNAVAGARAGGALGKMAEVLAVGVVTVGAGVFVMGAWGYRSTRGATRSAHVQWRQRQAEIEEVVAQAEGADPDSPAQSAAE